MDALKNMWGKTKEAAETTARSAKDLWTPAPRQQQLLPSSETLPPLVEPRGAEGEQGQWSRLDEFLDQSTLYILYNTGSGGTHSDLPLLLADLTEQFSSSSFEATNMIDSDRLADTIGRVRNDPSGRVLVIGGDGTIAWALQLLQPDAESPMNLVNASDEASDGASSGGCPPVAIWPGGTGNDLARVLGWGHKVKTWDKSYICSKLEQVMDADVVLLDQWRLSQYPFGLDEPERVFTNYLSVGADAAIALNFHQSREAAAARGASEGGVQVLENKMKYFASSISVAADKTPPLDQMVQVWCDDQPVCLTGVVAIVVLNISSYGAGADLWARAAATGDFTQQSISDGIIEVFGFESLAQMGLAQLNQSTGRQLAQGSHLRIQTSAELPWQVDGEPWQQPSCSAEINALSPVRVLLGSKPTGKSAERITAAPFQVPDQPGCKQQ